MSSPRHPETTPLRIIQAGSSEEISQARELFREYGATPDFGACFQGFEEEAQSLPGIYAPPEGRLLLAYLDGAAAGCIGFRKLKPGECEIRRLFVRPAFRGKRLGRELASALLKHACAAGYKKAWLGTLPVMKEAIGLYQSLGFVRVTPYKENALEGAIYMELVLG